MKSVELEQVLAAMRAGALDLSRSPADLRADFEAMIAAVPIAADATFEPRRLGPVAALTSRTPGVRDDAALLYLHGGGYVLGGPREYRGLTAEIGRSAGLQVLAIDYRLAPEHPFPAAVDDAVAAYRALLDEGLSPSRIVLAGDSAGGGLAVAMQVAARDAGLPVPAGAVAISPWADLSCSGGSMTSKAAEDPSVTRDGLLRLAGHYLRGTSPGHPLASPVHADLTGLPPLLIQVGSAEILLDDSTRLAAAAAAAGVRVRLDAWPDMVHVWHFFAFLLPEARDAIRQAGDFLRTCLAPGPAA
ncbi:MAG: alpha/beta hydrolase [Steroidobacteraceae bacterium]